MFYCLNIAPHETTYVPEKPSFKTKCCTHAHFACWCCHRPLAEVKIHTDNAGTAKWVQLDLQSIQHRDYFGHLSICHFKLICSLFSLQCFQIHRNFQIATNRAVLATALIFWDSWRNSVISPTVSIYLSMNMGVSKGTTRLESKNGTG